MSLPGYPDYKDSEAAWLGQIPTHWNSARLRWISERYSGGTPDKLREEYWTDGTIPWLNSGAVNQGIINEPSAYISDSAYKNSSAKWVPRGALIIALAGQGKTKGMVAQLAIESTCNQSMAAIVPSPKINSRFLFWWLSGNYQNIRNLAGGDLRDGLNLELLGNIQCPLLPAAEQTVIATFLDRETSKIDALVAEQEKLIALLKEKRQAVISHAVTKGLNADVPMKDSGIEWLGQVPEHWHLKRLKHIKSKKPNAFVDGPFGSNLKSEHFIEGGDVYVIESNFATQGRLDSAELKTISAEHFATIQRSEVEAGDIVIAKIGAQFGKSSILPEIERRAVVSGNSMKLSVNMDMCINEWIHLQLVNLKESGEIDLLANGSAQPALSLGAMNSLPMLIPTITEQRTILDWLNSAVRHIELLAREGQSAIDILKERRSALISAAVTGKIDVRVMAYTN